MIPSSSEAIHGTHPLQMFFAEVEVRPSRSKFEQVQRPTVKKLTGTFFGCERFGVNPTSDKSCERG